MRAVVQRVARAAVRVDGQVEGEIEEGLLVLVGVANEDGPGDVEYIAAKIRDLRLVPDADGRMNRSVVETGGGIKEN